MPTIHDWTFVADGPLGTTLGFNNYSSIQPLASQAWTDIAALGISRVRLNIVTASFMPTPGSFNWGGLDALVQAANQHGIRVTLIARGYKGDSPTNNNPAPCGSNTNPHYFSSVNTYKTLAIALCQRYSGDGNSKNAIANDGSGKKLQVDCIEIGNEEFDVYAGTNADCRNPLRYVYYLKQVVPAMRASVASGGGGWNPSGNFQARIGCWGLWWQQQAHVKYVVNTFYNPNYDLSNPLYSTFNPTGNGSSVIGYNSGLGVQMLDYLNFHNYSYPAQNVTLAQYGVDQELIDIKAVQAFYNDTLTPIWMTEFGADGPCAATAGSGQTAQEASLEATQSTYYAANADGSGIGALATAMNHGAQHIDIFTINYNAPNATSNYTGQVKAIACAVSGGGFKRFKAFTAIQNFLTSNGATWAAKPVPNGFGPTSAPPSPPSSITFYLGKVLDTSPALLATFNDVSTASGGSQVGQDTPIDGYTGYGECYPNQALSPWPAYASEPLVPFSNKGNIWPVALGNQAILNGNWTPTLRATVINGTGNITADLLVRVWVWNSVTKVATKYGVLRLNGNTITSTSTNFVFSAAGLGVIAGGPDDYIVFDTLANITANSNPAGTKLRLNFSSSSTQGNANGQITAPGMAPSRLIPMASALQGTFTRTISMASALSFQRVIPMASATSGSPHRVIPMTSSVCGAALANPYVQTIASTDFMSTSGPHLIYRGQQIKLYGTTIYLATQGGANTWLHTDARAVLDDLFTQAYNNGIGMIRITDYWDGSNITAFDWPQLWANIDYCVTRAQQLGMFIQMDISAYKNVLIANAIDWTVAANWHDWITFVGYHFRNTATSICWYSILGEPFVPANQADCDALALFYGTMCNTLYAADTSHLIQAGGLTHINDVVGGLTDPSWWYQVFTLPHNDLPAYKTYSTQDCVYLATMRSIMTTYNINKPLVNNEFGNQQSQGDQVFPAFSNTLNGTITAGATITALALHTAISGQTIIAGTIIAVSGTENYVVLTDTSSGTSLPVKSVTAQQNHANNDAISALGFGDEDHSLADTAYNYFSVVLGLTNTVKHWNKTARTITIDSCIGGDQAGTVSYVVWNLGYLVGPDHYDLSANTGLPQSWALYGRHARLDGYVPVMAGTSFQITVGGVPVVFNEDTFHITYKENEAWRCQFTILDYDGNLVFPYRSQVRVTDYNTQGVLFTGFLIEDNFDKSNARQNKLIEHKIDCIGNESKPMKRTSNRLYTVPFPAAQGVMNMLDDVLVAEGVTAKYAYSEVTTFPDWIAGTLSGTTASTNLPNGDLELTAAGSVVTVSEATTSDFAAGTLTNVQSASNALTLKSHTGISMTATCTGGVGDAHLYWTIYPGNIVQANDWVLSYYMWIDPSSPKIMAGIDVVYTDGSRLNTLNSGLGEFDQHGMGSNPANDLSGWADGRWEYRQIGLHAYTGKTINYIAMGIEGDQAGKYGVYFHDVKVTYTSTTEIDVSGTFTGGGIVSNAGYNTIVVASPTVYEQTGNRVSSSHSLTSVGIYQNSLASWIVNTPSDTTFTLETSFDGGATWQAATNKAKLGIITPGTYLNGISLLLKESMAITGNTPLLSPSLSQVAVSIVPGYTSTQTDVKYTRTSDSDFNAGTLTNLVAASNSGLGLTGFWRDWKDSDTNSLSSDQTVYGTASPTQTLNANQLKVQTNTGADARVKMVGAGATWQNFTLSVNVQIPTAGTGNIGVVYRTTGWQNNDNSFAYAVEVSSTAVTLIRGTNSGSGGGTRTQIATQALTLTVSGFYTLKVVVNSVDASHTNHTIYIDDVPYLTSTDNTYNAAGSIGMRLYNGSGVQITGYYGSLAILNALTGQYVSENLSLNAVGTVGTSRIFWEDVAPGSSSRLFETSINGGSTWQTASYGQEIVGLPAGTNVTGINLKVRITETAGSEQDQPTVYGYTAWVTSRFSSSGTYISPALSLATVGQVGNTLVSWAGLQPSGTTITVDSTINNGSSWQTNVVPGSQIAAGSNQYAGLGTIGNINVQPDPTVDDFSSDTSSNYTSTNATGGSVATWTPDVTNSRVTATGGANAVYLYTSISSQNMDILCDMTQSESGGLSWCYSSGTSYYSLSVADNQSTVLTPNTITLYRDGVSIGSTSIKFVRGIIYRIRVTSIGGVINVYFDGVDVISYNDTSALVAGQAGLFTNGGTSQFIGVWVQPLGDDVSLINTKVRINLASTDASFTPQIQTLSFGAYGPQINTGILMPSADYRQTFVSANLDDMAKQSNYKWHIDQLNEFEFTQAQARPAPWVLQSNTLSQPSDIELDSNLAIETLGDLYRNRQILTGVSNSAFFQDSFTGNGTQTSFPLRYPIAPGTIPVVTLDVKLNDIPQNVGLKGSTGSDWYYAENDLVIAQDVNALPLDANDTLIISYTGAFVDDVIVNNDAAQAALQLVEGGTGIVEAVEDVSKRNMSFAAAVTYGNQLLTRYCISGRTATFKTYRNGLAVGQMLATNIPEENLNYAQLLVHSVDLGMQTQPNNTVLYNYVVTSSELPVLSSWSKLLASGLLD